MSDPPRSPHRLATPEGWPRPSGYSEVVAAVPGRMVCVAGQTGRRPDGSLADDLVGQFEGACANVIEALRAANAGPEHVVSLLIFATDVGEYRRREKEIGEAYRRHFGKHYPAMALLGTTELYGPEAMVEVVATAVVPGR
ncbi:MAG: RidA family protein [Actinomycetota bacterium]